MPNWSAGQRMRLTVMRKTGFDSRMLGTAWHTHPRLPSDNRPIKKKKRRVDKCILKSPIAVKLHPKSLKRVYHMCIPTFKSVYYMHLPAFSAFVVVRGSFPRPLHFPRHDEANVLESL